MALIFGNTPTWIARDPINNFKCNESYVVGICSLGTAVGPGGSRIICKSSGVAIIVAPSSTEVTRTWYCREDAVTTAGSITGLTTSAFSSTGWFVPTLNQVQTIGHPCRSFWDSYSCTYYWSSSSPNSANAYFIRVIDQDAGLRDKTSQELVRAFRCVTY